MTITPTTIRPGQGKTKSRQELKQHCEYWSSEAIDLAAEEGGGLSQSDIVSAITDPPAGDGIDDPAGQKFVKDWVRSNWSQLRNDFKNARDDAKEKWESKMNEGRKSQFREGQRVKLKANEEEGWPEERGVVQGLDRTTMVVKVKPSEPGDDGIREVDYDQAEPLNEGRKSKAAHKFEDNYGTAKNKSCPDCGLPIGECMCEITKPKKKGKKVVEKKLKEAIRQIVREVLNEASTSQIRDLIGKEAAIKYRKVSTGEIKGYFGRFTKISGENAYMGVLGKGLRAFKIANILDVRPVSSEAFSAAQMKSLDEMCSTKREAKKK